MSAPFDLTWVITWLESGCDPKEAAKELRIYRDRMSAPAAPSVTVDTPEFQAALQDLIVEAVARGLEAKFTLPKSFRPPTGSHDKLVAHIDAHIARAVAAAREEGNTQGWAECEADMTPEFNAKLERAVAAAVAPLREALDKAHARQLELENPPAQPVAGELPPLPEPWITDQNFAIGSFSRNHYAEDQMRNYGRFCRAAQPVQKPAAVVGQKVFGYITQEDFFCIDQNGSDQKLGLKCFISNTTYPDCVALYTAPVPAAGVQPLTPMGEEGDQWYFDCDGHYIDVKRDENGKYSILFRNRKDDTQAWLDQADAAGVQGDTITLTGHQLRIALDFINPDGPQDDLQMDDELTFGIRKHSDDDGKVGTSMCCWNDDTDGVLPLDGEYEAATVQPDSGRDAGQAFEDGKRLAHEQATVVTHALMSERDEWKAKAEGKDSGRDAALEFHRGVIAALGALAPHSKHGDVLHDEIVSSVGKDALYKAAEPDDVQWAGLDPVFYATVKP